MQKRKPIVGTPADPTMEFATLEIDGQTYSLAYDFYAIAKAEQAVNGLRAPNEEKCNLVQGIATLLTDYFAERGSTLDARHTLGLLLGAMLPAQPASTIASAARLIRIDTLPDVHTAVLAAYGLSVRRDKKDSDPPEGAAAAPAN